MSHLTYSRTWTAERGRKIYRYARFSEPLMRAYVQLRAEDEGIELGVSADATTSRD